MSPILQSALVFCAILAAAAFGMLCATRLPEGHVSEESRRHFTATVSVVGTLAALVLGFAISNANTGRQAALTNVTLLSSAAMRAGAQLRLFGPGAADAAAALSGYMDQTLTDLFPTVRGGGAGEPNITSPATAALLDAVQVKIVGLRAGDDLGKFHRAQALDATGVMVTARAAIAQARNMQAPPQVIVAVTLWLAILFFSYGLFTPRHLTAIAAIVLTAGAVSLAIMIILQGRLPFAGRFHIPADALVEAVAAVRASAGGG